MQGDFDWSTGKNTVAGKNYQQPISRVNFIPYFCVPKIVITFYCWILNLKMSKLIESALEEMVCMRKESLYSWQHLLIDLNGISMCLFNIRLWNVHLEHFCSGVIYSTYSSLFCFSGTNINDSPSKHIDEILDDWKDIYENTQHGLALCCNVSKVNTIEVIDIHSVMEVLPTVLEIEKETFIGDSLLYAWCSWFFYRWLYFID